MNDENPKPKRMTLDRLANMIADGFHEVGDRMNTLVTKDEFNVRLASVEQRLSAVVS